MIAIIGPNLPQDVFVAADDCAAPLPMDADRPTPHADRWLESKFAPWARAILEGWSLGEFDDRQLAVFSRADDTAHRLYYYICELQDRRQLGGPVPYVMDIAKIPRRTSLAHTGDSVRALCDRLGVDAVGLEAGIAESNRRRSALDRRENGRICLLAGTPPPDGRLHAAIERAGFVPVGQTLPEAWQSLGSPVAEGTDDPFAAVAEQLHRDPLGGRSFANYAEVLRERITTLSAAAVVLWRIEEDEAQAWHLPAQRRMLEEVGIPALVLTRRSWRADDGAAAEIEAFLTELGR